jgi:cytochrome c oxidase subunit 3
VSAEFPQLPPAPLTRSPRLRTEDGHVDEHAHAHNPLVAHQFDDLAQQKEAGILGMWSFLATEIMFFGGALLAYAIYRSHYHYAFAAASNKELWLVGLFNTFVLLASSYTVVRAVHHAQNGRNEKVFKWIIITIFFGLAFIAIKGYEYHHVYAEHLVPGTNFDRQVLPQPGEHSEREFNGHWFPEYLRRPAQIFFSFYFALTGIPRAAHGGRRGDHDVGSSAGERKKEFQYRLLTTPPRSPGCNWALRRHPCGSSCTPCIYLVRSHVHASKRPA